MSKALTGFTLYMQPTSLSFPDRNSGCLPCKTLEFLTLFRLLNGDENSSDRFSPDFPGRQERWRDYQGPARPTSGGVQFVAQITSPKIPGCDQRTCLLPSTTHMGLGPQRACFSSAPERRAIGEPAECDLAGNPCTACATSMRILQQRTKTE